MASTGVDTFRTFSCHHVFHTYGLPVSLCFKRNAAGYSGQEGGKVKPSSELNATHIGWQELLYILAARYVLW